MVEQVLLTRKDVAKTLNCCAHTIRNLELRGKLPRVVLSDRAIRYRRSDLEKLIQPEGSDEG